MLKDISRVGEFLPVHREHVARWGAKCGEALLAVFGSHTIKVLFDFPVITINIHS